MAVGHLTAPSFGNVEDGSVEIERAQVDNLRMTEDRRAPRVELVPVAERDVDRLWAVCQVPDVSRYLFEDAPASREAATELIAESIDPARTGRYWRIATDDVEFAGIIGVRQPSQASLALRAIGWRSLELVVVLDPAHLGRGLATAAVEVVAGMAKSDGMTFAFVASVEDADHCTHRLMQRCGFDVLGRSADVRRPGIIYERAL